MSHYEDATPTWSSLMPIYLEVLMNRNAAFEDTELARKTVKHIAYLADQYVHHLNAKVSDIGK